MCSYILYQSYVIRMNLAYVAYAGVLVFEIPSDTVIRYCLLSYRSYCRKNQVTTLPLATLSCPQGK
jgi:hypothetical protein